MTCKRIRRVARKSPWKTNLDLSVVMRLLLFHSILLLAFATSVSLITPAMSYEIDTVSDYAITDVVQTSPSTIVVSAGCTYCTACNPNAVGNPGCTPFLCSFPPATYPSYGTCQQGKPDGRFAAIRITGTFGTITKKLICTPSNWPIGTHFSHNFVFTGLSIEKGEIITIEADFYCSFCSHWYATPVNFSPNRYSIVFVPLNWQGDLSAFNTEATNQGNFLIDNVGVLTPDNTELVKVNQNLVLSFDKTPNGYQTFNKWADISKFANDNQATGERYVAITNENIWGYVAGLSNWGPVVVVKAGYNHVTAHELGHTWVLLDEYNPTYWQSEKNAKYPTTTPPNSYPGGDAELATQPVVKSYGRQFDSKRCIMGSADLTTIYGNPITRGFCLAHTQNSISYDGCSVHVDDTITDDWSLPSSGLVKTVITFYKNGSSPKIEEIGGIPIVGRPMHCSGPQNFSLQVYSEDGHLLDDSNIAASFWLLPSQVLNGTAEPIEADSTTVSWLAPMFSETTVKVDLKDNTANQVIATQNVTVPHSTDAWIDYAVTNKTSYEFRDSVEVVTEVNTSKASTEIVLDVSLLDPNGAVRDYASWTGTIYPTADSKTLNLKVPNSGIDGKWTIYITVLNSTGQYQESRSIFVSVYKPVGGVTVPIDKLCLLFPRVFVSTIITAIVASSICLKLKHRNRKLQTT